MSTSHDQHPRHLEFEPNNSGSQKQKDSSGNYYESHHAIHTPGQHGSDQQQQGRVQALRSSANDWISRGNNKTIVGASLAVIAAGAFVGLTRNKWSSWGNSLSDVAKKTGLTGSPATAGSASGSQSPSKSSQSGNSQKGGSKTSTAKAGKQSDAQLNQEVASKGIKSSPTSGKSFTDEGATGNND